MGIETSKYPTVEILDTKIALKSISKEDNPYAKQTMKELSARLSDLNLILYELELSEKQNNARTSQTQLFVQSALSYSHTSDKQLLPDHATKLMDFQDGEFAKANLALLDIAKRKAQVLQEIKDTQSAIEDVTHSVSDDKKMAVRGISQSQKYKEISFRTKIEKLVDDNAPLDLSAVHFSLKVKSDVTRISTPNYNPTISLLSLLLSLSLLHTIINSI